MASNTLPRDQLLSVAAKVQAVVLDGDGVIFTGRVLTHPRDGEFLKERSHIDGQGISLLRAAGMRIAFVTGENSGFVERLAEKLNGLPSVRAGHWPPVFLAANEQGRGKVEVVRGWLQSFEADFPVCAVMGDDLSDLALLELAGLAAAPAQAEAVIKERAHWIAPRRGGDGAIRDLADLILAARGVDVRTLPLR
ncbi:hypothetical protein EPN90_02990 [Patescibacteria group bacterium]|nr:MAG: hypothetical protein EPN90_02990 [Patescibacteria group bacterium]